MGQRNYLVEGVSSTGKTAVCNELLARGFEAINGDRELAYQGDPSTGEPKASHSHHNHIWNERRVRQLAADSSRDMTFFCGGSRNFSSFLDVFDEVFILEIDVTTLEHRLTNRPLGEFGSKAEERDLIRRLHRTREDVPRRGIVIDATAPLHLVVDGILDAAGSAQV